MDEKAIANLCLLYGGLDADQRLLLLECICVEGGKGAFSLLKKVWQIEVAENQGNKPCKQY
jgi:hypothetical protein